MDGTPIRKQFAALESIGAPRGTVQRRIRVILLVAAALAGCATTPTTPGEKAKCGAQPTEDQMAIAVQTYIKSVDWKDPDSVHVRNIRLQPDCVSVMNLLLNGGGGGGRAYGFWINFDVNARNSFGGYTGFQLKSVLRSADGQIHLDPGMRRKSPSK
jgi:hypothetical protein